MIREVAARSGTGEHVDGHKAWDLMKQQGLFEHTVPESLVVDSLLGCVQPGNIYPDGITFIG